MQHDTVIWGVISPQNGGFCSFRRRLPQVPTKFCKNPYNVLGLCTPKACPLANSRYATIMEHKGKCYLMIKTIERSHTPNKHWEKIELSEDYMDALNEIDQNLAWWPKYNKHKCKLRLTKIHQYLMRARKLALTYQPKLVRISKPYERQQKKREAKAERAAKISVVVKEELIERLQSGVYEGIYNYPFQTFDDVVDNLGEEEQSESEEDEDKEEDFVAEEDIEDTIPQKQYEREFEFEVGMEEEIQTNKYQQPSSLTGSKSLRRMVLPRRVEEREDESDSEMVGDVSDDDDNADVGRNKGTTLGKRGSNRLKKGNPRKKRRVMEYDDM